MAAIQQDTVQDFYPFYSLPFNTYNPPMSDSSPQAASGSIPLVGSIANSGSRMGNTHASNTSTALWAGALVIAALVLMHLVA